MTIKFSVKPLLTFECEVDKDIWEEADHDAKMLFITENLKEYIDDIIEEIVKTVTIKIIKK